MMQNEDVCPPISDPDDTNSNTSLRVEKSETPKKADKKDDAEDPKPRIVLTFRSEKCGAKTSNMKIVTPEERHEEVSPRRSSRTRHMKLDTYDDEPLLRKDKGQAVLPVFENDETPEGSLPTPKRLANRHNKDFDVIASAIARKEKSYNDATPQSQRLSRRTKPTPKVLAKEELRISLESQSNSRLSIQSDKTEEGVSTRRSGNPKGSDGPSDRRTTKRKAQGSKESEVQKCDNSVMKLKHLCELGLKAINKSADEETSEDAENRDSETSQEEDEEDEGEGEDEEIDDDTEVINKLLEADEESGSESSDDEFLCSEDNSQSDRPRRSRRLCSSYVANDSDQSSPAPAEEKPKSHPRRSRRTLTRVSYEYPTVDQLLRDYDNGPLDREYPSKRKKTRSSGAEEPMSETEHEETSNPTVPDESAEAACPTDTSTIIATCFCEEPSNVFAAPSELTEPVFCQAIEVVDGVRVGCSHRALREEGEEGARAAGAPAGAAGAAGAPLAAMRRAGPRAPYFLACKLHAAQLAKHMCCPTCGLFCTQGIFNQCSKGHLFHVECGVLHTDKLPPGCPHCGVSTYRWQPANRDCGKVTLHMHCSNERIYLPDQREQCTPAYIGFPTSNVSKLDQGPIIPEELLPPAPIDVKKLCETGSADYDELLTGNAAEQLFEAIVNGETTEQLIPKIVVGSASWAPLEAEREAGGSCVHAAAARGHLAALHLLHCAGAPLHLPDDTGRTPLMRAVLALLDKESPEEMDVEHNEVPPEITEDKKDEEEKIETEQNTPEKVEDEVKEECDKKKEEKPDKEALLKVIKYLIAAGCDLDFPGPEGMSALHVAAAHGGAGACELLLRGGAAVDARDHGGWTPLVRACENSHPDVVRVLLSHGADAAATDKEGNAVMHWCALAGDASSLRELLHRAPHAASAHNRHADTPLHVAAREGHYSCVVMLLARGARTDVENSAGELPVEVCTGQCQTAISLNMQMALAVKDNFKRHRLLTSDISRGREPFPVPCENAEDEEPLPSFTYVARHVLPAPLDIDCSLQTMKGCACAEGECGSGACACCALGVRRWYAAGRLPPAFPFHDPPMLFECNHTCGCDLRRCTNRVVSRIEERGSLGVRVGVFRTRRRGWGLRALERVPRGTAVALYCGELLPHTVADTREQDHYMFALDLKPDLLDQCGDKPQLCVDAARLGSSARFVNHSCRPNLAPVRVFTAARDLRLPTVALFATRDVPAGEELTFDYGDKFWSVKADWMKCECGAPDCRNP